jgi:hypothetical protein
MAMEVEGVVAPGGGGEASVAVGDTATFLAIGEVGVTLFRREYPKRMKFHGSNPRQKVCKSLYSKSRNNWMSLKIKREYILVQCQINLHW